MPAEQEPAFPVETPIGTGRAKRADGRLVAAASGAAAEAGSRVEEVLLVAFDDATLGLYAAELGR